MKKIVIEQSDIRIDKYLSECLEYSRSLIIKMLEQGDILVNEKIVKPSYKTKMGDKVEIVNEYHEENDILPIQMDLNILYEDEDIMVINKPAGVVVHPGNDNQNNTLANGLVYYTQELSDLNGENRPGIVHRLDKDTSGIMLVAKSNRAHAVLGEDFKNHDVKREYVALLCGVFPHNKAKIDAPIGRDKNNRKRMAVTAEHSKHAITHVNVLKRFKNHTLVCLHLETGRTHQIRVHMQYIGYPVFNDPVYGHQVLPEHGQFLHSRTIDFLHPITKEAMHFSCELPDYFSNYIQTLEEKEN